MFTVHQLIVIIVHEIEHTSVCVKTSSTRTLNCTKNCLQLDLDRIRLPGSPSSALLIVSTCNLRGFLEYIPPYRFHYKQTEMYSELRVKYSLSTKRRNDIDAGAYWC